MKGFSASGMGETEMVNDGEYRDGDNSLGVAMAFWNIGQIDNKI